MQCLLHHFSDSQKEENHNIFQNTAVPEGPRKEKGGFPEGVPEGFFSVDFFLIFELFVPRQPRATQGSPNGGVRKH